MESGIREIERYGLFGCPLLMPEASGNAFLILLFIVAVPACLFIGYLVFDGIRNIVLRRRRRRER